MTTPRTFDIKDLDEAMVTLGRLRDCLVTNLAIEEPTGLGAVVRSSNRLYVRTSGRTPWYWATAGAWREWPTIKEGAEILSLGVDL